MRIEAQDTTKPRRSRGPTVTRRRLLAFAAYGTLGCALPLPARGRIRAGHSSERVLSFYNLHTGERLRTAFQADGRYLKEGLAEIDHLLRDHRTNDVHAIDPRLLDLLYFIRTDLETNEPFHVISGYRSPATNAMLGRRSGGVGRRSLHMQGMAIDVCVPGCEVSRLHRVARAQKAGGVGYYPGPGFVHVDVGRVRYW